MADLKTSLVWLSEAATDLVDAINDREIALYSSDDGLSADVEKLRQRILNRTHTPKPTSSDSAPIRGVGLRGGKYAA